MRIDEKQRSKLLELGKYDRSLTSRNFLVDRIPFDFYRKRRHTYNWKARMAVKISIYRVLWTNLEGYLKFWLMQVGARRMVS